MQLGLARPAAATTKGSRPGPVGLQRKATESNSTAATQATRCHFAWHSGSSRTQFLQFVALHFRYVAPVNLQYRPASSFR
jgi:hypothetical protein